MSLYNPANMARHSTARSDEVNRELAKIKAAFDQVQTALLNIQVGNVETVALYTWRAYANSADGTIDFTTAEPAGHSYIGLAFNRLSPVASEDPLDYEWSPLNAALQSFVANDTLAVAGRTASQLVTDLDTLAQQILAYQYDGQTLRDYVNAKLFVDGVPVNTVITNERTQWQSGDTALAATLGLLGAKNTDGSAFIIDMNKAMVSPTVSLGQRISAMQTATANAQASANSATDLLTGGNFALASDLSLLGAKTLDGAGWVLNMAKVKVSEGQTLTSYINAAAAAAAGNAVSVTEIREAVIEPSGSAHAKAVLQLDVNGKVVGYAATNDGSTGSITFKFDSFNLETPAGDPIFSATGSVVKMHNVEVDTIKAGTVFADTLAGGAAAKTRYAVKATATSCPRNVETTICSITFAKESASSLLEVTGFASLVSDDDLTLYVRLYRNATKVQDARLHIVGAGATCAAPATPFLLETGLAVGNYTYELRIQNNENDVPSITAQAGAILKVVENKAATVG